MICESYLNLKFSRQGENKSNAAIILQGHMVSLEESKGGCTKLSDSLLVQIVPRLDFNQQGAPWMKCKVKIQTVFQNTDNTIPE